MTDIREKIASGLERAFARSGFAEPSVDDLKEQAGVSLRTLYKYVPSREQMVIAALEHRHRRYIAQLFTDLPETPASVLPAIIDRVGAWMETEASHGCLFHAAVAAAPHDEALHALLEHHKKDVASRVAEASGLIGFEVEINLILEGLTQSWPVYGAQSIASAKRLAALLREAS